MKCFVRPALVGAMLLVAAALPAQEQDAEGCKDSPIITRMPGSTIHSCENKEFDQTQMPLGTDKDGNEKNKTVEGEFHSWDYGNREGTSEI